MKLEGLSKNHDISGADTSNVDWVQGEGRDKLSAVAVQSQLTSSVGGISTLYKYALTI